MRRALDGAHLQLTALRWWVIMPFVRNERVEGRSPAVCFTAGNASFIYRTPVGHPAWPVCVGMEVLAHVHVGKP